MKIEISHWIPMISLLNPYEIPLSPHFLSSHAAKDLKPLGEVLQVQVDDALQLFFGSRTTDPAW
jgi:hypothetical protein